MRFKSILKQSAMEFDKIREYFAFLAMVILEERTILFSEN